MSLRSDALSLPNIKKRRNIPNTARGMRFSRRKRTKKSLSTLTQTEFSKRIRLRDTNGNTYALPKEDDAAFVNYLRSGSVSQYKDFITIDSAAAAANDVATMQIRSDVASAFLYIRKKRGRELTELPRGSVRLLDLDTKLVYEGDVRIVFFENKNKHGHIILRDFSSQGRVVDINEFSSK